MHCNSTIVDLAPEGSPGIHLRLPPTGCEATLKATIAGHDFSSDTFTAQAAGVSLPVDVSVVSFIDLATVIKITFPGSGIDTSGDFGLRWETASGEKKWPLTGSYERKSIQP